MICFTFCQNTCLYTATKGCRQTETGFWMDRKMQKDFNDIPLSESNVSLKLADIQRRCAELLQDSDNGLELTLEEPIAIQDGKNPYDLG